MTSVNSGSYNLKVDTMGIPWNEAKKVQVSMTIDMGDGTFKIFEGIIPHK